MDRSKIHNPFVDALAARFTAAGYRLYLVGGVVRDVLAERAPGDMDLATDAPVEAIKRLAGLARPTSIYPVGEKFGTIGVIAGGHNYEITTFRAGAGAGRRTRTRRPRCAPTSSGATSRSTRWPTT